MPHSSARFCKLVLAGLALFAALWIAQWPVLAMTAGFPGNHTWLALLLLAFIGALTYGAAILGLFGKAWVASFWRTPRTTTPPPSSVPPAPE